MKTRRCRYCWLLCSVRWQFTDVTEKAIDPIFKGQKVKQHWLRFFRTFSSVVRQMPGLNPQRRGTAHTLPNFCVVLCIVCFVSFSVLFVCICVLYYCHRVATQLQLNISYHIIRCVTTQKSDDLIYTATEAWNLEPESSIPHAKQPATCQCTD
jgi:hypothetical protein